ncbi:hypothetical protein [Paraburkholderia hospita]|uniref:hypothetical protein n=1 Tax=Paraburkholderia hospita TaxID=169430 RepID=UPI0008A80E84|nr:hypothetical protein [Paraburkholderia hospita]SEI19112.1 hypothetical protein SAMN05192544_103393 [Paraburkholderia hospita]
MLPLIEHVIDCLGIDRVFLGFCHVKAVGNDDVHSLRVCDPFPAKLPLLPEQHLISTLLHPQQQELLAMPIRQGPEKVSAMAHLVLFTFDEESLIAPHLDFREGT